MYYTDATTNGYNAKVVPVNFDCITAEGRADTNDFICAMYMGTQGTTANSEATNTDSSWLLGLLKESTKIDFLSISLILSITNKNFNLSIVIDFLKIDQFFRKKNNLFGENGKKFYGRHDHFLGEGFILH